MPDKSIDLFRRFGFVVPCLQQVRWTSEHLKAFLIVGRGHDGSQSWMSQRNQTENIAETDYFAFKDTFDIFMQVFNLLLTMKSSLVLTRRTIRLNI